MLRKEGSGQLLVEVYPSVLFFSFPTSLQVWVAASLNGSLRFVTLFFLHSFFKLLMTLFAEDGVCAAFCFSHGVCRE